jgi:transposase
MFGISKRENNTYLRRMFVHGARAVLLRAKYDTGGMGQWVHQLEARTARNKVVVAIANKLARIDWAVLFHAESYRATPATSKRVRRRKSWRKDKANHA